MSNRDREAGGCLKSAYKRRTHLVSASASHGQKRLIVNRLGEVMFRRP